MKLPQRDSRHGTVAGYAAGCRCKNCSTAMHDSQQEFFSSRIASAKDHGNPVLYSYGCRCDLCRTAYIKRQNETREARRPKIKLDPVDFSKLS